MRIIHTSDWHLGRIFYKVHLTEEQAYVLDQLVGIVREERPDLVVIAGDVYDRSAPPAEAVELLDDALSRIVLGLGVPVVAIAGNHDSPERLGFCSSLLSSKGLFMVGAADTARPIEFCDQHGPVWVVPVPYAEPAVVRDRLEAPDAADHDAALGAQLDAAMAAVPPNARRIAVAHALTYGGQTSGSERPLTLGGTGAVDAARFDGFCYAALGHLHRPQQITGTGCRYSGSLMKYSFDEADHAKSVSVVDIDGQGNASVMAIPLTPRRDVRRLRGSLQEIVEGARRDPARDDYISITLVDAPAVWDALARLREHYPNVMHLEFEFTSAEDQAPKLAGAGADWSQRSLVQLFCDFYQQTTGAPIEERHMKAFLDAAERVASDEKEVAAS